MRIKPLFKASRSSLRRKLREHRFPYEAYMNRNRLIFIHIPRSGGTAVRVALGAPETGRLHLSWYVYYQANPRKYARFYKAAFLRHPVDRAYSAYLHLLRGGNRMNNWEASELIHSFDGFSHFVKTGPTDPMWQRHTLFIPQTFFVCDYLGNPQVDFLGRTEKINEDGPALLSKVGIKRDIQKINSARDDSNKSNLLDSDSKRIIETLYEPDFDLLDRLNAHQR